MSSTVNKLLKDVGVEFGTKVPENPAPLQFKEENQVKEQRLKQEKRQKTLLSEARDKKPTIKPI